MNIQPFEDSRFSGVDQAFINRTIQQSISRVNQAVNNTLRDLQDPNRRRTPADLLRLMRYPPTHAIQVSRAAEIYEQALETIFNEVHAGVQYSNITDGEYLALDSGPQLIWPSHESSSCRHHVSRSPHTYPVGHCVKSVRVWASPQSGDVRWHVLPPSLPIPGWDVQQPAQSHVGCISITTEQTQTSSLWKRLQPPSR